jgi:hypothetical protein
LLTPFATSDSGSLTLKPLLSAPVPLVVSVGYRWSSLGNF